MAGELVLDSSRITLDRVKSIRDFCGDISGQLVSETRGSGKVLKRRIVGIWEKLVVAKRSISLKGEPLVYSVADAGLSNIAENGSAHEEH